MKFDRTDLIDRVNDEIARREQITAEKNATAVETAATALAEHVEQTSVAWSAFATAIRRAVRVGRPVTLDDVPAELRDTSYSRHVVNTPPANRWEPTEETPKTADLHTLRALLVASTDQQVSLTEIERAGFKIIALFRK